MPPREEYFFIYREDMPCIYELSWDTKTPAIVIRIHRDFVANIAVSLNAPIVCSLMGEFAFSTFDCFKPNLFGEELFGFDGALQRIGEEKDFVVFEARIPKLEKQLGEACRSCDGTKEDKYSEGQKCLDCKGTGSELVMDWKPAYAVSATFTILFELALMRFWKGMETSCDFSQLLSVETITARRSHGGSLNGMYSINLGRFLSSFKPNTEIIEMTNAMVRAWDAMFYLPDQYNKYSFWAKVAYKNGWLNVSCPGDACGLHPMHGEPMPGGGYEFGCHNVDNPMQQIALIAGLAALCDKAKKEIGF